MGYTLHAPQPASTAQPPQWPLTQSQPASHSRVTLDNRMSINQTPGHLLCSHSDSRNQIPADKSIKPFKGHSHGDESASSAAGCAPPLFHKSSAAPSNGSRNILNSSSAEKEVEDLHISLPSFSSSKQGAAPAWASGAYSAAVEYEKRTSLSTIRLERIRAAVRTFLDDRFSVHEYTVPRLFIVLPESTESGPQHGSASPGFTGTAVSMTARAAQGAATGAGAGPSATRFRLFFLCECSSSFTLPLGSGLNHLHIAKHSGYEIQSDRKQEFFERYGDMILMLLYFLKYGQDSVDSSTAASSQISAHIPLKEGMKAQQKAVPKETSMKVEKISNLRRSDLPDSIAQEVEIKFDRMIAYLENLQEASALSTTDTKTGWSHEEQGSKGLENGKYDTLSGLSSLSDLHQLYSFLGIANSIKRLQSGQLGNLYRISNVRGQVSWVCVYHYRWTFLERNIDEFERWVISRRGLFDKQSGSVSITLFSRAHTRTFCTWIANKVAPSLVEVHIKLGWSFGKKDLWRLAKTLAASTVTVLSLDGCSFGDDSTYKMLHKKYDPLFHLLTHGQLHSLELLRFPSMFARLSPKAVKAPSLQRLEFGRGMEIGSKDRGAFSQLIASCTSLQELILPGFIMSDLHMQAIITGIRAKVSLVSLDLSNSQLNDGAAIILAQGLYSTNICHLDLSKNEALSDTSAARVIRAIGPRLTSLKMARTGFGDLAASALAKSMDGISFSNTLQSQLHLQSRLDIAAIAAGHRPGMRFIVHNPLFAPLDQPLQKEMREKTHARGHLVYLDIEDNHCTIQGFKSLARIKSRLYLVYLNLSGSKGLQDKECAQILEKVTSAAIVTLRLACTGFGNLSAKSLAKVLLEHPFKNSSSLSRISGACQLEELDLQACPIGSEGILELCHVLDQVRASSSLKILDLGHCGYLHDQALQQLLRTLVIQNASLRAHDAAGTRHLGRTDDGFMSLSATATTHGTRNSTLNEQSLKESQESQESHGEDERQRQRGTSSSAEKRLLTRSDSDPTPLSGGQKNNRGQCTNGAVKTTGALLPRARISKGFFTNLRQLDIKSTRAGDDTAWLLAQALVQPWAMIDTLTILDPMTMTIRGICGILDALCENASVQEFGIGKSDITLQTELDLFGSGLLNMMEMNKRIRSLTTLGAPLGSVAKGLLLNQCIHSVYLIQSKGQFEDLQLMGQVLGFTRSLLVFWMGGSDDSLLGPLQHQHHYLHSQQQHPAQALAAEKYIVRNATGTTPMTALLSQEQHQQQPENMYRHFHLLHHHEPRHELYQRHRLQRQQQHYYNQHRERHARNRFLTQNIGTFIKSTLNIRSKSTIDVKQRTQSHIIVKPGLSIPASHSSPMVPNTMHPTGSRASLTDRPAILPTTNVVESPGVGSGPWTSNPIIEGVRRNHSLIKVTLDSSLSLSSFISVSQTALSTAPTLEEPGVRLSRVSTLSGVAQDYSHQELQQLQLQQERILRKKIVSNRKMLRERSRVGWEELKLLGVDDDVIAEVCQDTV
ncbi:hypothetical protein EDD11_003751 [Mortierella claussenii]|nr:hypothetical protein EDD11_003751 [Mortierella claussenii]